MLIFDELHQLGEISNQGHTLSREFVERLDHEKRLKILCLEAERPDWGYNIASLKELHAKVREIQKAIYPVTNHPKSVSDQDYRRRSPSVSIPRSNSSWAQQNSDQARTLAWKSQEWKSQSKKRKANRRSQMPQERQVDFDPSAHGQPISTDGREASWAENHRFAWLRKLMFKSNVQPHSSNGVWARDVGLGEWTAEDVQRIWDEHYVPKADDEASWRAWCKHNNEDMYIRDLQERDVPGSSGFRLAKDDTMMKVTTLERGICKVTDNYRTNSARIKFQPAWSSKE